MDSNGSEARGGAGAMIVGLLLLAIVASLFVTLWRAGEAAVPRREREAAVMIRKHGQCTTVKRPV